ncbi:hypothetical protein B0T18DRAFT_425539 [Schizothecium vesticola]|uniref:Uncharacterized protein n=1 Tax=Schizothecium vesticola TaxID=314040 RepID=A0AA40F493_9PEZI|nr:hypothetical protein B0T18DRAFT_425539 [Schizothecium vesticola]
MASSRDLTSNLKPRETSPSLFHAANHRTDQGVSPRKSYGGLSTKPDWEEVESTIFRDPFKRPAPNNNNNNNTSDSSSSGAPPSGASHPPSALLERSTVPSLAKPPLAGARRKPRYPSSYGRKAGNSLKRGAARPILSEEEGRAVPPMRRASRSLSWGRRAAAAAFAVGRRLKERGGTGRRVQAAEGEIDGVQGRGPPSKETQQRGSGEWDVFVARPRGGLQHPRPSRVVKMHMLDDEVLEGERGSGRRGV